MNTYAYHTLREKVKDARSWELLKDAMVEVLDALYEAGLDQRLATETLSDRIQDVEGKEGA